MTTTWGEPDIQLPPSPKLSSSNQQNAQLDVSKIWDLDPSGSNELPALISETELEESREPLVLPSSPPKGSYQPMTVTGSLTPTEVFSSSQPPRSTRPGPVTRSSSLITVPTKNQSENQASTKGISEPSVPVMSFEDQLKAAIRASLEPNGQVMNLNQSENEPIKELGTEEEQMSKALEESLAMSSSRTLENSGRFLHPYPTQRVRELGKPVALRVQNPHLVFLPAVLNVLYAAKPFRDRILAFKPPAIPDLQPLVDHDVEGLWKGESKWRTEDSWSPEPYPIELILAVQRLFALMTHSKRSYLDVREISLCMGYEEGENIVWSLNEPNKGCHKAYETIAETWKELCSDLYQQLKLVEGGDTEEHAKQYEDEKRLFHWRGHKMSLPLPDTEVQVQASQSDNSTTCLILNTMGSALNDIYSGIDAQVWLPESNSAHFLDGTSQIIAFEIDRKNHNNFGWTNDSNTSCLSTLEQRKPFGLESEFYVDRYLLDKRHVITDLREEISKIEGEADVSLVRRDQLAKAGGKDVVSNLKSVVDYLSQESQFPITTSTERESQKKEMLPKFRAALEKLEAEITSLELKAATAQAASKAVFDIPQMKEVGPHDLCAVVVSDGFAGRDHMWTYTKADDGSWYKILDRQISSVTLETVLNDPAGIHMNGGHIFALYVKRSTPEESSTESASIPLRPSLEAAIMKDNEEFDKELSEAATIQLTNPLINMTDFNQDVKVMDLDSPRSDVAEADELGSESDPLRLSGGSGLDQYDEDENEDEDEEEEEEEEECDLVELGFLKSMNGQKLDIKTMTGKIGGRPIWLDPKMPLENEAVKCSTCSEPMAFLLQMNAPDDENPNAYLRTIYIFICRKMKCIETNRSGGLKVFRFQVSEEESDLISSEEEEEGKHDGLVLDKEFREWELVCDEEPEDTIVEGLKQSAISTCNELESKTDEEDAKMKDTKAPVDLTFLKFQSRLSRAPDQILRQQSIKLRTEMVNWFRYLKVTEPAIKPLWASDQDSNRFEEVQVCGNCGRSNLMIEFQILSTVLSSLGIEEKEDVKTGLDFGTILVYTCERSCEKRVRGDGKGWVQEVGLVQMFSLDGVKI
ncbi:uncharacterized protein MELLADRAFT_90379 [Melampsora larici-populina 98AG31]|uniref:Programmed cell death protein 2 C-terminal domain-containing protein n=1 Tax=Melampsora larici-populina (strain 98AG31 / pathotype 3-4-7) TaxID=747676 RepID=F4RWP8_MELLP|nr:uncharacterized protein MELLADRAFT_90379 [Melampsora larici-populina 98AG31]EGG03191.1 hypothetical protein MELLADRAFT_90379 [Melampsora larici-populina 98AG31]